jgi:hypothetical protein
MIHPVVIKRIVGGRDHVIADQDLGLEVKIRRGKDAEATGNRIELKQYPAAL